MHPRSLLLSLLLLFSLSASAQLARNELAVSLGRWDSDELGNGPMIGASYNHYWARVFSTRVGGFVARDFGGFLTREGDASAAAAYVSGELHFFREARVSPWVGAGGAIANTLLASNDASETTLTGIYSGGVDVAISPRFAIGGEFSYMNYEAELGNRFGYNVKPVMITLSGRWRY